MHNHHPIYCILPPHVLKKIAENGTAGQRDRALHTMNISEQLRGRRNAMSQMVAFAVLAAGEEQKTRTVYDARFGSSLPGTVARKEGDPPVDDVTVNEAYDGSGVTYDLYSDIYGRNSIDGNGMKLDSTVHYQKGFDNAFWNGSQMVYGDGDEDLPVAERLFNRFTIAIDVIGHELTHGVTQYEANLAYFGQSGALNESWSDVFGSLVKQYNLKQAARDADWIIGQGLITANVNGIGLRSMKAPGTAYDDPLLGKDPQPAHMKDYVNTVNDNGGVHINSGIPNRAFYVTALEIGGFAWNKAGLIWYKALTEKLISGSNFQEAADLTFATAGELYGVGSLEQNAVKTGWAEVGITVDGGTSTNPGCLARVMKMFGLAG
ncbi:MAG: peptidase M4 family protein [Chloroflexi bacterium]|nr:MAG: peptidase M4 family protein [Chloroflexota bacterium]